MQKQSEMQTCQTNKTNIWYGYLGSALFQQFSKLFSTFSRLARLTFRFAVYKQYLAITAVIRRDLH